MKLIVCSKVDQAGQNIKEQLLNLLDLDKKKLNDLVLYTKEDIAIVETEEKLIYADRIDEKIKRYIDFEEIIFISRHSSHDRRKILTAHFTGNVARAEYGGKPYSLAKPSPQMLKRYCLRLFENSKNLDYQFSLEATHHGPSEINVPSVFIEIGSTENEWRDSDAAFVVAKSIVEALTDRRKWMVAMSVGGTHYMPRQSELIISTEITFGHSFPKYTFEELTTEFLIYAYRISEADIIVIDEKSVNSRVREKLREVAGILNTKVMKTKDVKIKFTKQ